MADRIFKGRLITTGDIHEENQQAFSEASEELLQPHRGGLVPFHVLQDILAATEKAVEIRDGEIYIQAGDYLAVIKSNGDLEIAAS
ncbi:MAG: hypothetical protein GF334_03255 [Candidatus Altiarchaeales archaeon]|nr:hypothetical protein [Candidatus Altiarchaeales archaeon]